jgi:hypothetical protein
MGKRSVLAKASLSEAFAVEAVYRSAMSTRYSRRNSLLAGLTLLPCAPIIHLVPADVSGRVNSCLCATRRGASQNGVLNDRSSSLRWKKDREVSQETQARLRAKR